MGLNDIVDLDEALEHRTGGTRDRSPTWRSRAGSGWLLVVAASLIFLVSVASPPRLMDDVDAVQAQIARNMLVSGDWVTARLNGVAYLEKSPLIYWMMATSFRIFGVHDWSARLPLAFAVVLLCWVTFRFGRWAFGEEADFYTGIVLSTSVGLFLFTRILIPDATVTLCITGAIWAWLRLLEPESKHSTFWGCVLGLCLGAGLLLKGLMAVVFPLAACLLYMTLSRQLFSPEAWRRLHVWLVIGITMLVAAPWHVLATIRNPPYFSFSMHSGPGEYRGFFWFYFFNEHLLRFLNLRYPHDYNTVPRPLFWLLNLVWIFPWSAYLIAAPSLAYQPTSRAARVRLIAVCWIAVVMLFFTFSTTQEYYSMPIYPALALLIGSSLASGSRYLRTATSILLAMLTLVFAALSTLLLLVWRLPVQGNISSALTQHPEMYTLSLGHLMDLTLGAFAYLKFPLALAAFAFGASALALGYFRSNVLRAILVIAAGMIIFFQAARIALIRFDPYLGSYPLAEQLQKSPPGQLIEANSYYAFSTVFFYANRTGLLLNGRNNNLEYGSYAPGAPDVFIDDGKFAALWGEKARWYLLAYGTELPHLHRVVGAHSLHVVAENAGNYLFTNHEIR